MRFLPLLPLLALIALFATTPSRGQSAKDGGTPPPPDPTQWTRELTVSPAPAPVPALRYELLPKLRDRTPGNAAVHYLRAAVLRPAGPQDPAEAQRLSDRLDRWEAGRIDQLPVGRVKEFLKGYRDRLAEAADGARCDRCDWQQDRQLKPEDIGRLFPGIQHQRDIARFLGFRARVEMIEGRPDDALATLQTGFQMGKHIGEGPTFLQMLVGIAVTQVMLNRAEEFVARPGAPNLYWALTALPRPFIDPRPALEGEAAFQTGFVPGLEELARGPVSEDRAGRVFAVVVAQLAASLDPADRARVEPLLGKSGPADHAAAYGPAAKRDLVAAGRPAEEVKAMPNAQAVLLRGLAVHREFYDEQGKFFFVPYWTARPEESRLARRYEERMKAEPDEVVRLFAFGFPSFQSVHFAHARLGRRLAQLRALEAVRLHLAAAGKLPASLADVTAVPVPDDPFTGKPFGYEVTADGFTLTAPPLDPGQEPRQAHVYRVTVRK